MPYTNTKHAPHMQIHRDQINEKGTQKIYGYTYIQNTHTQHRHGMYLPIRNIYRYLGTPRTNLQLRCKTHRNYMDTWVYIQDTQKILHYYFCTQNTNSVCTHNTFIHITHTKYSTHTQEHTHTPHMKCVHILRSIVLPP